MGSVPAYTKVWIDGTRMLPAAVGQRARPFDTARSMYNLKADNFRAFRAVIARANAGTARGRIAFIGHSEIAGQGATPGTSDVVVQVRRLLAARGYRIGGTGWVFTDNNIYATSNKDSRWVHGSGWAVAGSPPTQLFGSYPTSAAVGAASVFTADVAGSRFDTLIWGNSPNIAYTVRDAGGTTTASGTLTANGSQALQSFTTVTPVVAGGTITFATTSNAKATFLIGANVYTGAGLEVSNHGIAGAFASDWVPAPTNNNFAYNPYNITKNAAAPDAAIIQLDANEPLKSVATADLVTNLQTLITNLTLPTMLVLSCSPVGAGVSGGNTTPLPQSAWDAVQSAIYGVADANDLPLLDLTNRFGTNAQATANSIMADNVHPNAAGYGDAAQAIANTLTS